MTAKEKAISLYNKFSNTASSYIEGKKCALICVDEIITIIEPHLSIIFWQEMKEEINKL